MLQTVDEIYKIASISLSPNVPAQIFVSYIFSLLTFISGTPEFCHVYADGVDGQPTKAW